MSGNSISFVSSIIFIVLTISDFVVSDNSIYVVLRLPILSYRATRFRRTEDLNSIALTSDLVVSGNSISIFVASLYRDAEDFVPNA